MNECNFMGAVVIQNEMNFQILGNRAVNDAQKFEEFCGAMTAITSSNDFTGCHIQGRKQRNVSWRL